MPTWIRILVYNIGNQAFHGAMHYTYQHAQHVDFWNIKLELIEILEISIFYVYILFSAVVSSEANVTHSKETSCKCQKITFQIC